MIPRMKILVGLLCALLMAASVSGASSDDIVVGEIEFDQPTIHTIGLSLPVLSGDQNFNARARLSYRPVGSSSWNEALPLQRVRTDTLSHRDSTPFPVGEQFAGSIFDLQPDTAYEVALNIADPDGGDAERRGVVRTRFVPPDGPSVPHIVSVNSDDELGAALSAAKPGDVIRPGWRSRIEAPFVCITVEPKAIRSSSKACIATGQSSRRRRPTTE